VHCAIYEISAKDKLVLDRIEGVGLGYSETTLTIPNVGYHEFVMIGAHTHGFPDNYLKQIGLEQSLHDPDRNRSAREWETVEMIRGAT